MDNTLLDTLYKNHKSKSLFGRYIHLEHIQPLLDNFSKNIKVDVIGHSVNDLPIHELTIGNGSKKILMWSQMHGNESTTTKAIFDILNAFEDNQLDSILSNCTLKIIPILNPDGAKSYTRLNANEVDLNRDAQMQTQPESKVLLECFNSFKPDFCFNLHGQRTMYSAGKTNNAATLSFLSPAEDIDREVTTTRKKAMEVIAAVNTSLQHDLPNQIGRYDDGFNLNCVGDTFQSLNCPTLLFEAGHCKNDYNREEVRRFVFSSILISLDYIANNEVSGDKFEDYFNIPENDKLFFDIIIRNAKQNNQIVDIGINYEEVLKQTTISFIPKVIEIKLLPSHFGHKELDANKCEVFTTNKNTLYVGYANDFVILNNENFSLKN